MIHLEDFYKTTAILFKQSLQRIYGPLLVEACNVLLPAPSRHVMMKAGLLVSMHQMSS